MSDVFATEFVDFCDSCRVLARLLVKVRWIIFAIDILLVKLLRLARDLPLGDVYRTRITVLGLIDGKGRRH